MVQTTIKYVDQMSNNTLQYKNSQLYDCFVVTLSQTVWAQAQPAH